ncbi:MAG: serine hydrolase domain-containing protein [Chloroflexota bacterium]
MKTTMASPAFWQITFQSNFLPPAPSCARGSSRVGFTCESLEGSDSHAEMVAKSSDWDEYTRRIIDVEQAAPFRMKTWVAQPAPRPADVAPPARLSTRQLSDALQVKLQDAAYKEQFWGAVAIAKGADVLFQQAVGPADLAQAIPNGVTTKFRNGSMNKMFTAVAVAQLAECGRLRLDEPLATYLPDYPNPALAGRVMLRHLLSHTGGTGDIFGPLFRKHRVELRRLPDYVAVYGARDLAFEPGARFEYSNYGFILLGLVVEAVSGESYFDYVDKHVFGPAGMADTGLVPEDISVTSRAVGYTRNAVPAADGSQPAPGELRPNSVTLPYRGTSAGGGYTTVGDLIRFATALTGHRLVGTEYTDSMTTGRIESQAGFARYGYGFTIGAQDEVSWYGHGGGAMGMNGDLRIFRDSEFVVAVLSNLDPPAATRVSTWITGRLQLQ